MFGLFIPVFLPTSGTHRMAVYTTFFLCKSEELPGGFPGWRLPLPQPVHREIRNPFTGETSVIETREPIWPEEASEELSRDYRVLAIEGRYEDYLEGRLPPFVHRCPHWAAKSLTEVELRPLLQEFGVDAGLECAIYSPPSAGAVVQQLPSELLPKLGSLDQTGLKVVAKRWAATMSTPEYTHSVSGEKLSDGWTVSDAMEILKPIVALARKAAGGQELYLLIEV
jgi:hypothetical protein